MSDEPELTYDLVLRAVARHHAADVELHKLRDGTWEVQIRGWAGGVLVTPALSEDDAKSAVRDYFAGVNKINGEAAP